jgi:rfaE bifunctional protein kinase chain/domain
MNYLKKKFNDKILNSKKLDQLIKKLKKSKKKIVMCHGTFDLVHPGHIRHLFYAKSKGDVLIVSITGDKFVTKQSKGTYVPEDLRIRNLAALELVDYTFIDYNFKPLSLISKIKPNYFVKGYEYNLDKTLNTNTLEEKLLVEKFGGKIIFSPGDVVYSSTKLQKTLKPNIKNDKFISLLKKEKISINQIINILKKKISLNIHVIGDLIIDKYNYCDLIGQSTKTPTFSVKPYKSELFVGGAGIVAKHLKAMGANVFFTSIAGSDEYNIYAKKDLIKHKIKTNILVNKNQKTILKERFWNNDYKLLQVDYVDNEIIDKVNLKKIFDTIKKDKISDCVVFSDFRHGMFNKEIINSYLDVLNPNIIKIADSQVSSRWGNILDFKKVDIIFPNELEARFSLGDQDSGIRSIGTKLIKEAGCKNLVLKLGEKGSMVFRNTGFYPQDFFPLDSFVKSKVDAIGAGDAYLSATTVYYCITKNIVLSSIIGNFAAAIACEQEGNVPISKEQIISYIKNLKLN